MSNLELARDVERALVKVVHHWDFVGTKPGEMFMGASAVTACGLPWAEAMKLHLSSSREHITCSTCIAALDGVPSKAGP